MRKCQVVMAQKRWICKFQMCLFAKNILHENQQLLNLYLNGFGMKQLYCIDDEPFTKVLLYNFTDDEENSNLL